MYEITYLEPDAEITSVIDRLKSSESKAIALVVPRGATLAQSIVNLKLLKRSASGIKKQIAIISTDKISRNLAAQVGLSVFSKVDEAEKATPGEEEPIEAPSAGGFKVNNYYSKKVAEADSDIEGESEEEEEEISPKTSDEEDEEELKAEVRRNLEEAEKEPEKEEENGGKEKSSKPQPREHASKQPKAEKFHVANADDQGDSDEELEEEDKDIEPVASGGIKENKPAKLGGSRKILLILVGVIIVIGLVGAYLLVPYADAKVVMKTEDSKFEKEITVDTDQKEADIANLKIPGQIVEVDKDASGSFNSTGTKDEGTKAAGKITISNTDLSNSALIPKGSRFVSGGKAFLSTQDATVPLGSGSGCTMIGGKLNCANVTPGSADVNVTAENAGEDYNIEPSTFVIASLPAAKQKVITGKSSAAMAGGATKVIKIIQDSDLTGAEKKLLDDAKKTSAAEMQQKAGEDGLTIFVDSIKTEVASSASSKKEGEEADKFDYQVKIKFYVLGYLPADLTKLATDSIGLGLTGSQMIVSPENSKVETALVSSDVDGGIEKIKATGRFKIGNKISDQEVVKKIKGKKIGSAKNAIEAIDGVNSSEIKIRPSLIKQVPFLEKRIKVEFGFAVDDVSGN